MKISWNHSQINNDIVALLFIIIYLLHFYAPFIPYQGDSKLLMNYELFSTLCPEIGIKDLTANR